MLTEKETETIIKERFELWFEEIINDVKEQDDKDAIGKVSLDLMLYKKLFFSAYLDGTELATELIGGQK